MRILKQGLRRHANDSISVGSGAPSAMLEERLWGSHNRKPGSSHTALGVWWREESSEQKPGRGVRGLWWGDQRRECVTSQTRARTSTVGDTGWNWAGGLTCLLGMGDGVEQTNQMRLQRTATDVGLWKWQREPPAGPNGPVCLRCGSSCSHRPRSRPEFQLHLNCTAGLGRSETLPLTP